MTSASVGTGGGKAGLYFKSAEAGTYTIKATAHSVSASSSIKVKEPAIPPNPHLQIFDIVPDQGTLDGGDTITIYGKDIVAPVIVTFTVDGTPYEAHVLTVDEGGAFLKLETPKITAADPTREWDADVEVKSGPQGSEQTVTVPKGFHFQPTSGVPEIYQLYPDHGSPQGGEQIVIYGQNFKAPVRVKFATDIGTVDAIGETVSQDGRQITVVTPQISASPVTEDLVAKVIVINEAGTGNERTVEKENAFVFSANATVPRITNVVPDHGSPLGGERITIYGENFKAPVRVQFTTNLGTVDASGETVSADGTAIELTTPQISAQPITEDLVAKITVINQFGTSSEQTVEKDNAFVFSSATEAPEIYQLVPDHGTPLGGDTVTIEGKNFKAPVKVQFNTSFGTADAVVNSVSSDGTAITIVTPQITAQPTTDDIVARVKVINQFGTSSEQTVEKENAFIFSAASETPEVYQVYPDHGTPRGGDQITIFGQNLKAPAKVRFVTSTGTFEGSSETVSPDGRQIQVITPQVTTQPLTEDLVAKVVVVSAYGTSSEQTVEKENGFVFTAEQLTPNIATISPINGPVEGGTQVTIFAKQVPGSGFQFPVQVVFTGSGISDHEAQVISVNQYQIVCLTPDVRDDVGSNNLTPPFAVDVKVTNVDSGLTATATAAFTYGEPLMITGNTPTEGPMKGGDVVTIYGSGFRAPLWVDFSGENIRLEVISVSGDQILVKMPAIVPPRCNDFSGAFTVTLQDNGVTTTGGQYKYLGWSPEILSVDPPILSPPDATQVDVDELTIHGKNFHEPVQVAINGLTFTASTPGVTLTLVDEETITLSGIQNLIGPDAIGLHYNTTNCVINGGNGQRDVATGVDVSVTNLTGHCSTTLAGAITYEPWDTVCHALIPDITVSPTNIPFSNTGAVTDGTNCSSGSFTITNAAAATGNLTWNVNLIGADPTEFTFTGSTSGTLAPGDIVSVPMDFCPTSVGDKHATVEVHSNDPDQNLIYVSVDGTGVAMAVADVVPTVINFSDTNTGNCTSAHFTVSNSANATADLTWNASGLAGTEFNFTGTTGGTIQAGNSVSVPVDFCPTSTGDKNASVTVTTNDPNNPSVNVALSGTGL